jgi:hypothetical protein
MNYCIRHQGMTTATISLHGPRSPQRFCQRADYRKEIELLKSIPGVKDISAMIIIAETGGDMGVFENSGKIIGWAGLRPRKMTTISGF